MLPVDHSRRRGNDLFGECEIEPDAGERLVETVLVDLTPIHDVLDLRDQFVAGAEREIVLPRGGLCQRPVPGPDSSGFSSLNGRWQIEMGHMWFVAQLLRAVKRSRPSEVSAQVLQITIWTRDLTAGPDVP